MSKGSGDEGRLYEGLVEGEEGKLYESLGLGRESCMRVKVWRRSL
jgi:hypothetical protein